MMMRSAFFVATAAACLAAIPSSGKNSSAPSPRDDFYSYINASWSRTAQIPDGVPWTSPFVVNTLRVQDQVRTLISQTVSDPSPESERELGIAAFHQSFSDEQAIDTAGLNPLNEVLMQIRSTSSKEQLAALFGRLGAEHADFDPNSVLPSVTPAVLSVWNDRRDATKTALVLRPTGLGLPDRAYYLDPELSDLRSEYQAHIANIFELSSLEGPHRAARSVLHIETQFAHARLSQKDLHDAEATWHPIPRVRIATRFPGFAADDMISAAGVEMPEEVIVTEPGYFERLGELIAAEPLSDWQAYLLWQVLHRYSPYLPTAFREANFAFYGKQVMGNAAPRPRSELAGLAVETAFPNVVGRLWVERHVDPGTKAEVTRIAEVVRAAFAQRIERNNRYTAKTKAAALEKLANLHIEVAYPDEWPDSAGIQMQRTDLIGNLRRLAKAAFQENMQRLDFPVDRSRWYAGPQDTSAYYVRSTNSLAVPAGLLQAPWYDPEATDAENFAGVGTVIGHEMGHAFDNQGSQFDAFGNLRDWWTNEDSMVFDAETMKLVKQYENFEALPGVFLNGRLTVSEAYGDLMGLIVAYDALLMENGEEDRSKLTKDYLASFCRHWRAKYSEPLLRRVVASDGHAPQRFRCNGPVSAFSPFYEVYDVKENDAMFIPLEERAKPW